MLVAVCGVFNSWWWTERPCETCTVLFQWNKFETLMHLVGFTIEMYYDARPYERQNSHKQTLKKIVCVFCNWACPQYMNFCSLLASKQTSVSVWHMPVAVCTVLNSWWWTERPSETRTVSFQNKIIWYTGASGWFYYRNSRQYSSLKGYMWTYFFCALLYVDCNWTVQTEICTLYFVRCVLVCGSE